MVILWEFDLLSGDFSGQAMIELRSEGLVSSN